MTDQRISRGRFVAGTAAAFASIAIVKAPARAADWSYKYASNVSVDHPLNVRMKECWTAVNHETSGRLDVQIFPNNQLGGDTQALQQLRSGLGFEPGEVVGDRRLGVVQLLCRRGDRSMARDGVDDAQPVHVQHASTLSMSQHESRHWTYEAIACKLRA